MIPARYDLSFLSAMSCLSSSKSNHEVRAISVHLAVSRTEIPADLLVCSPCQPTEVYPPKERFQLGFQNEHIELLELDLLMRHGETLASSDLWAENFHTRTCTNEWWKEKRSERILHFGEERRNAIHKTRKQRRKLEHCQ